MPLQGLIVLALAATIATGCAHKKSVPTVQPLPASPLPEGTTSYKVMTSWDPVSVYYDVRFTFEIVDGKGVVRSSP